MELSSEEDCIFNAIRELDIVDAHEHLPPEKMRLAQKVDVFTLFSYYARVDLIASGMPQGYLTSIYNPSIPISDRWKLFAPYLKNIRYCSSARPAFIAAKEFYGFDDINESNYKSLSEQIAIENIRGIYNRVLRKKCNIRVALSESVRTFPEVTLADYDLDLLMPVVHLDIYANVRSRSAIEEHALQFGERIRKLDDYIETIMKGLKKWKSMGVVGLKMWAESCTNYDPDRDKAASIFDRIMRNERGEPASETNQLRSFLIEQIFEIAADLELVVAVHTGMNEGNHPYHMIPILERHPDTRFDIYHGGMPWFRETAIMSKTFPNVWINLCWCHLTSQRMSCRALDELIELVPVNKIIAFGGDHGDPLCIDVENVYGHLLMAQENVAKVLGHRVKKHCFSENEAVDIAKKWFYDNPKDLYQLSI